MSYFLCTKATLPVPNQHLLLLCRAALLHSADCLFCSSLLSWTTAYLLEKKRHSCRWFGCLKECWLLFRVIALFSLPICLQHTDTKTCVHTSSVALWGFWTCLLAHRFFQKVTRREYAASSMVDSFYVSWSKGSFKLLPEPWLVTIDAWEEEWCLLWHDNSLIVLMDNALSNNCFERITKRIF